MAKTLTSPQFAIGEKVACYAAETLTFGEVINIDGGKVTVAIQHNIYSTAKNSPRATQLALFEYVRRADGLFVTAESVSERVPTRMIASMDDIGAMNQWRYFPSPIEKLKRKFSN